jgi:hypothetical protein
MQQYYQRCDVELLGSCVWWGSMAFLGESVMYGPGGFYVPQNGGTYVRYVNSGRWRMATLHRVWDTGYPPYNEGWSYSQDIVVG